jgi:hypothetical protein
VAAVKAEFHEGVRAEESDPARGVASTDRGRGVSGLALICAERPRQRPRFQSQSEPRVRESRGTISAVRTSNRGVTS